MGIAPPVHSPGKLMSYLGVQRSLAFVQVSATSGANLWVSMSVVPGSFKSDQSGDFQVWLPSAGNRILSEIDPGLIQQI